MNKRMFILLMALLALIPATTMACDGGASLVAGKPQLVQLFSSLGTPKVQLGLFLAYFGGLFWSVEHKKPYGEALMYVLFYPFTLVILLVLIHFGATWLHEHWIWQTLLIPALYLSLIGTFFVLWSHKYIVWRLAVVSLLAVLLTGYRMELIC